MRYARHSEDVPGFDKRKFCLTKVRVEIFCGFVFVCLDADAAPLSEQMPGLEQEWRDYEPRPDATPGLEGGFNVEGNDYPQHLNWWLWPNLCPMSIPGGGFRVLHIMPDGPEGTKETYDFYLPYAEPTEKQNLALRQRQREITGQPCTSSQHWCL